MQKKLESTTSSEDSSSVTLSSKDGSAEATVSCDQCEHRTKTEGGMKQHKRRKHDVAQLDGSNSILVITKSQNSLIVFRTTVKKSQNN